MAASPGPRASRLVSSEHKVDSHGSVLVHYQTFFFFFLSFDWKFFPFTEIFFDKFHCYCYGSDISVPWLKCRYSRSSGIRS